MAAMLGLSHTRECWDFLCYDLVSRSHHLCEQVLYPESSQHVEQPSEDLSFSENTTVGEEEGRTSNGCLVWYHDELPLRDVPPEQQRQ